jgi:hypothetical protein
MINRATGEVGFKSGLHILPHCPVEKLAANAEAALKIRTQNLSLKGWKRHVFGFHREVILTLRSHESFPEDNT